MKRGNWQTGSVNKNIGSLQQETELLILLEGVKLVGCRDLKHHPFLMFNVFWTLCTLIGLTPTAGLASSSLQSLFRGHVSLGGGFKYFYFHPYLGKIPILTNIFQMG